MRSPCSTTSRSSGQIWPVSRWAATSLGSFGDDMQIVEIELDPNEVVIAEAGAMNWMEDHITFEAKMGDGSKTDEGFMGKLLVFLPAFEAGLYPLLAVAIVGVVLSIYYYFGWIKAAFFPQWRPPVFEGDDPIPEPPRQVVGTPAGILLATVALASVLLGFYQGPIGQWLGLG